MHLSCLTTTSNRSFPQISKVPCFTFQSQDIEEDLVDSRNKEMRTAPNFMFVMQQIPSSWSKKEINGIKVISRQGCPVSVYLKGVVHIWIICAWSILYEDGSERASYVNNSLMMNTFIAGFIFGCSLPASIEIYDKALLHKNSKLLVKPALSMEAKHRLNKFLRPNRGKKIMYIYSYLLRYSNTGWSKIPLLSASEETKHFTNDASASMAADHTLQRGHK